MAKQLIESRSQGFDPSSYKNHYADALRDLVKRKVASGGAVAVDDEAETGGAKVIDFMDALKRSLGGGDDSSPKPAEAPAPKPKAAAKKPARAKAAKPRRQAEGGLTMAGARGADDLPRQTQFRRDTGAGGRRRRGRPPAHRPASFRHPRSLRSAARNRRRAGKLGGDARTVRQPERPSSRRAHRGPSAQLRRFRGDDPQGPVWRRNGHSLGIRQFRADQRRSRRGGAQGRDQVPRAGRADARRLGAGADAHQGEARELVAHQGARRIRRRRRQPDVAFLRIRSAPSARASRSKPASRRERPSPPPRPNRRPSSRRSSAAAPKRRPKATTGSTNSNTTAIAWNSPSPATRPGSTRARGSTGRPNSRPSPPTRRGSTAGAR